MKHVYKLMLDKGQDFFVFLLVSFYLVFLIFINRNVMFTRQNIDEYRNIYQNSNYVIGERGQKMSDDDLYALSGVEYLQGVSPKSMNFEHPPFAKILFGISYNFFGNARWGEVLIVCLYIIVFYKIAKKLFQKQTYTFIALFLFLLNSLVYHYFTRTMLDISQSFFILLSLYFYVLFLKHQSKKHVMCWAVAMGLSFAVKYPFPLVFLFQGLLLINAFVKTKNVMKIASVALLSICIYMLPYMLLSVSSLSIQWFIDHARFEYWRLHWYLGKLNSQKGLILQTVLLGKNMYAQYGNSVLVRYEAYTIMWPLSFILFCFSWIKRTLHIHSEYFPYKLWTGLAFLVLLLGASNEFYLIPLMPGFILFGVQMIEKLGKKKK